MRSLSRTGALFALAIFGVPLAAQVSGLERVEELTRLGRTAEARSLLIEWWNRDRAAAPRDDQQRALWLRGRLTVDPATAQLDFRRLTILYPGGAFTDRALLRLAQAAHALGDGAEAEAQVATLKRDYPNSAVRREAEAWLAAAGPVPPPPSRTETPDVAPTTEGPPRPRENPTAVVGGGEYSVQLGAFGEEPRAIGVYDGAAAAGFAARVVRVEGSPLYHVRVGAYPDRDQAERLLDELTSRGLSAAIVRDARAETIVRP